MVYESNQHDDAATPDNIVRSQFGSPRSSANGSGGQRDNSADVPETYRFDPHKPRRRRYANDEHHEPDTTELPGMTPQAEADPAPEAPTSGWTVARPRFGDVPPNDGLRRLGRAERRRAAEGPADETTGQHAVPSELDGDPVSPTSAPPAHQAQDPRQPGPAPADQQPRLPRQSQPNQREAVPPVDAAAGKPPAVRPATIKPLLPTEPGPEGAEQYASNRKSDLTRIASFLRSTQEAGPSEPAPQPDPHKTSELPTVPTTPPPPPPTAEKPVRQASPTDAVLEAVQRIPGVTGARFTEADQKLALDIADDADTDLVQAKVAEVLNSRMGLQAQPVKAVGGTIETEPGDRLSSERAVLERIQVITSGFESTVEVALALDGSRAVGRSHGPAVEWHILRAAADATVDAVGVLVGKDARVVVEHASVENAGSTKVALVVVLLLTESGAEQLAGAAPVTGDRRQAVVHATLSALNRRIEAMLA
ncbi:hypothetical protein FB566_1207 [Stackebrandtia endophytica]|uniref:Uncharacterized protein n=1 Tax=Stackebrandtia endophytica TaxID=1496996 RepID=A0A543AT61_9ACTN|nr:hypothetical protein FB566_1207 [Stackebrandtia endophytica]